VNLDFGLHGLDDRSTFLKNLYPKDFRLDNPAIRPPEHHPALDFPKIANLKSQENSSVPRRFDHLASPDFSQGGLGLSR
jgi:hypothetical protein